MSLVHRGINFVAFQVAWFACVMSAAAAVPEVGLLVAITTVLVHLVMARQRAAELWLVISAVGLGLVFDSLLAATGWVRYPSGAWIPGLAPYWMLALWAVFATTLNVSMRWLHGRYALAMLMGGIFGPLSYLAGEKLGGMTFLSREPALAVLAAGWALMMPVLVAWAARLDAGRAERAPRQPDAAGASA